MIKISKLVKKYDGNTIINNLNLEIKTGSIFGFLGPNGAGKTTTIKMLVDITSPTAGVITIDNKKIDKNIIGYMPEDPYFYDHLSAKEFLNFVAGFFKVHQNIDELLKLVNLEQAKNKKIGNFSKGMKQRLGLAQALINDPKYLFLDEPLDGLDPIGRLEFKEIILQLKKENKTIFFNSHILSDVEEICDKIGVLNKGKLIYSGDLKTFCKNGNLEKQFVKAIKGQK